MNQGTSVKGREKVDSKLLRMKDGEKKMKFKQQRQTKKASGAGVEAVRRQKLLAAHASWKQYSLLIATHVSNSP